MALMKRSYTYKDAAGTHFPDASSGDIAYYALDLTCLVDIEKEGILSVSWETPEPIQVLDQAVVNNSEAQVKLSTPIAGVFPIKAVINSLDEGRASTTNVNLVLKVI